MDYRTACRGDAEDLTFPLKANQACVVRHERRRGSTRSLDPLCVKRDEPPRMKRSP